MYSTSVILLSFTHIMSSKVKWKVIQDGGMVKLTIQDGGRLQINHSIEAKNNSSLPFLTWQIIIFWFWMSNLPDLPWYISEDPKFDTSWGNNTSYWPKKCSVVSDHPWGCNRVKDNFQTKHSFFIFKKTLYKKAQGKSWQSYNCTHIGFLTSQRYIHITVFIISAIIGKPRECWQGCIIRHLMMSFWFCQPNIFTMQNSTHAEIPWTKLNGSLLLVSHY